MLIPLLVVVIIVGLLLYLIQILPIGAPFKNIAYVLVVLICIIWLLSRFGSGLT
ncbi:MAG TPA: Thivi_2564 family membrane protein [Caulobacteraceae bacterium]|jgi:hypothetical protein